MQEMQEQERLAREITLDEVTEAMPRVFKRPYNTPQKLKASLQKKGLKAVLLATKCGECKAVIGQNSSLTIALAQGLLTESKYSLPMYNYMEQIKELQSEDGLELYVKANEVAKELLRKAGAFREQEAMAQLGGDSWLMLACFDKMVKNGKLRIVEEGLVRQHRIYTA